MTLLSCHLAALCSARAGEPSGMATAFALTPMCSNSPASMSFALACMMDSTSALAPRLTNRS